MPAWTIASLAGGFTLTGGMGEPLRLMLCVATGYGVAAFVTTAGVSRSARCTVLAALVVAWVLDASLG